MQPERRWRQAQTPAVSRVVRDERIRGYFEHEGHRTAISQGALQAHSDPWVGWCELDGVGQVIKELSPYEADLDWSRLSEPADIGPVVEYLGRATAKVHCVADADADRSLVPFQTEDAIAQVVEGRDDEFVAWVVEFAHTYAARVRTDHALFVDAFRGGAIPQVAATA